MTRLTTAKIIKLAIIWYKDFCRYDDGEKHTLKHFRETYTIETIKGIHNNNERFPYDCENDLVDTYCRAYMNNEDNLKEELSKALKKK